MLNLISTILLILAHANIMFNLQNATRESFFWFILSMSLSFCLLSGL